MNTFFTSESVTEGHPDKVCDQIADAILDALLEKDPHSHVACEVTAITDAVHIFGEITSAARVDYEAIARQVIREIGYTKPGHGFDADSCRITVDVHQQSPETVDHLCDQCEAYAKNWKPTADPLWQCSCCTQQEAATK